jgi:hypothetical protein
VTGGVYGMVNVIEHISPSGRYFEFDFGNCSDCQELRIRLQGRSLPTHECRRCGWAVFRCCDSAQPVANHCRGLSTVMHSAS